MRVVIRSRQYFHSKWVNQFLSKSPPLSPSSTPSTMIIGPMLYELSFWPPAHSDECTGVSWMWSLLSQVMLQVQSDDTIAHYSHSTYHLIFSLWLCSASSLVASSATGSSFDSSLSRPSANFELDLTHSNDSAKYWKGQAWVEVGSAIYSFDSSLSPMSANFEPVQLDLMHSNDRACHPVQSIGKLKPELKLVLQCPNAAAVVSAVT